MRVRVITLEAFDEYCERNSCDWDFDRPTEEQFMQIYNASGDDGGWEFDSLEEFECEFNEDGPYAPTPSNHIIMFFPNE